MKYGRRVGCCRAVFHQAMRLRRREPSNLTPYCSEFHQSSPFSAIWFLCFYRFHGLQSSSQSCFGGATNCGFSKMAPASLFFTKKIAPHTKRFVGLLKETELEPLQKPCLTGPLALLSGLWRALANSSSLDYSFLQWKIKHNPTLNICISLDGRQFITFQCTSTPWKILSF